MNVIVVGCGRFGAELASRLYAKGNQVAVIDQVASAFDNLNPDFRGRIVEGDVLSQDLLRRAGIEQADGLAAVTSCDTLNAVVGHLARTVFRVPNVVVRNYAPRWRALHESFGLQVISSTSWGAQRFEEMLDNAEFRTVFSAGNGEVEVYEIVIPPSWCGRLVNDLMPTNHCTVVALTRAGRAMLPDCDARLETDDVVHLSATLDGIQAVQRRLQGN